MLYLQRLIATDAATPELQRAILANGLVNTPGLPDSWYPTDKLVELHNGVLKSIFNDRRGSSITVKYLMGSCAVNTEYHRANIRNVEQFFKINSNGEHAIQPAMLDIKLMARLLVDSGSITGNLKSRHTAIDLFDTAIDSLSGPSLAKFNVKETAQQYIDDEELEGVDGEASEDINNFYNMEI